MLAAWVADATVSNWNDNLGGIVVPGRYVGAAVAVVPENSVQSIIEPAKIPRNPFNGGSIFLAGPNDPVTAAAIVPGALACAVAQDSSTGGLFNYYAFLFQGTDSTGAVFAAATADYHGGMAAGGSLPGAREGVFFTKVRR